MFTVLVVVVFFFCFFFSFVESVEKLITFTAFTILLPVVDPVLFVFLHLPCVVVLLMDIFANVFSICQPLSANCSILNQNLSACFPAGEKGVMFFNGGTFELRVVFYK